MAETLSTARFLLVPFRRDDADALHSQWNDPDIGRWPSDGVLASFAVMERLGMPFWKEITLHGRPARYHRVTVSDRPSA